ncbi:RsmB/NOP family class I SAM-dependent RNA methyltransferase [Sphingosinicella rhizophila]|uniref:RsmB/NOP family class I SAM-dependent RNA methyltransferase n=1 Tax=Sphingosinicella rhizophila TaxID=3050082 RepID=A0ABU3Q8G9_9SPHN|nr:RsmB/NOP family class I SAM-dependent RNA methyltransferase [Sphingosinicella sp. GR2756]MDT9599597.1 RsmB/NOP family class I SAM-dependent RNA methyltransferase [Sphingosinicella sp. GR2756]
MSRPDPVGAASRRAAMRLLDAVLRKGLPLEAALDGAARDLDRADDRAFAHAIAAETLRRLSDLDILIDSATRNRLADDSKARAVLRIALVQVLAMRTPPHAAIATVLPLVEGGPKRLVHGVFGALMRSEAKLPESPSLPALVEERWRSAWGAETAEAAARLLAVQPPLDLIFASERPPEMEGISLLPRHLRVTGRTAVADLAGYGEGRWWVQDVAASVPARLLGAGQGRVALDLCAAPGGKTMQLAAAGFDVTALDVSKSRLARLSENLERTGLNAEILVADLMKWEPKAPADAILLDAPCSATGIFRRHPDVLHRVRPRAIAELAQGQRSMLARAAAWLKPGGSLIYSVCSLEPEEGEAVADAFLAERGDFELDPVRAEEVPSEMAPKAGRIRLLPGTFEAEGGCDGFFVARFRRIS